MKSFFQSLVLLMFLNLAGAVHAADCAVEITAGDNLAYSLSTIQVSRSCESVNIAFKHLGSLPAAAMGHNFVIAKSVDLQAIQNDGNKAGMSGGYLKSEDDRVIVASQIIGGGEATSVELPVGRLAEGQDYSFFCTVMSHSVVMKGTISLVP